MANVVHSLAIIGTDLRYVDDSGAVWTGTGTLIGAKPEGSINLSIKISGTNLLYIGADGNEYQLQVTDLGAQPAGTIRRSVKLASAGTILQWLDEAGRENKWYALFTATFNSTDTWTVPTGVYKVQAECWGGGGPGGAYQPAVPPDKFHPGSPAVDGWGGGGGGYSKKSVIVERPPTFSRSTLGSPWGIRGS
jgi:hypothetical protein